MNVSCAHKTSIATQVEGSMFLVTWMLLANSRVQFARKNSMNFQPFENTFEDFIQGDGSRAMFVKR